VCLYIISATVRGLANSTNSVTVILLLTVYLYVEGMLPYEVRCSANEVDLVSKHVDSHCHRHHSAGHLRFDESIACRTAPEEPVHRPTVSDYHRLGISVVPPVIKAVST